MLWEDITGNAARTVYGKGYSCSRAPVPGGWMVFTRFGEQAGVCFVPDPAHSWDGKALWAKPPAMAPGGSLTVLGKG